MELNPIQELYGPDAFGIVVRFDGLDFIPQKFDDALLTLIDDPELEVVEVPGHTDTEAIQTSTRFFAVGRRKEKEQPCSHSS